jgi:hypothetical protein
MMPVWITDSRGTQRLATQVDFDAHEAEAGNTKKLLAVLIRLACEKDAPTRGKMLVACADAIDRIRPPDGKIEISFGGDVK